MKDLAREFDKIPQEFDPEIIWEGIERPVRPLIYRPHIWGSILAGASLVILILGVSTRSDFSRVPDKMAEEIHSSHKEIFSNPLSDPARTDPDKDLSPEVGFTAEEKIAGEGSVITDRLLMSQKFNSTSRLSDARVAGNDRTENGATDKVEQFVPESITAIDYARPPFGQLVLLPPLPAILMERPTELPTVPSAKITVAEKKPRHSISLRIGAGSHWSSFAAVDNESASLRSSLEKPQLDYSIGVRYAYLFDRGFILSLSANYNLFKDRITTSHISDSSGQEILVDYKIYNHYHVFTGSMMFGKRFEKEMFFWDVNAGLGFKLHQISDVDYFVAEGLLAEDSQTEQDYQSTGNIFFTANAAIGKYLSGSTFVRLGCRMNSSIRLTSTDAEIEHRILPVSGFVEIGTRF